MAKKRTLVAYYGKRNQRLDAHAAALTKQGKDEEGATFTQRSREVFYTNRKLKKA